MTGPRVPADLTGACGKDPGTACKYVFDHTSNESLAKLADWAVDKPLRIAVTVVAAFVIVRILRRIGRRFVRTLAGLSERAPAGLLAARGWSERSAQRAKTIEVIVRGSTSALVWTVAGFASLGILGFDLATLVLGSAFLGAALGIGAQGIVRDTLAGFFMLVEDQCGVGDIVQIGDMSGRVERLSLRTTRLRDAEGTVWHVSNGDVRALGNKSLGYSVAVLDVDVTYDADIDEATRAIQDAAATLAGDEQLAPLLLGSAEVLGVQAVTADRVTLRVQLRTTPGDQWTVVRALRGVLKQALDHSGLSVKPAAER